MSRCEDVDNSIWVDPDFLDLSPDSKLLYLWSFTNPHCNMAGLYRMSRATMAFESALPARRLDVALEQLHASAFLTFDGAAIWVRSRVKHLRSRGPSMAQAIKNDVTRFDPEHVLRRRFLETYGEAAWIRDSLRELVRETLSTPSREGLGRVSQNGSSKPNPDTLPGGSPEGVDTLQGKGKGSGCSNVAVSFTASVPSSAVPADQAGEAGEKAREDVVALCSLLADLIAANGSKRPTVGDAWHTAARLLLDHDKRPYAEAERLIRWSQADEFWRTNVLSMPKFREQYDRLRLKAGPGVVPAADRYRSWARLHAPGVDLDDAAAVLGALEYVGTPWTVEELRAGLEAREARRRAQEAA